MKILIIEDDREMCEFLKSSFEAETTSVDLANNGIDGSYMARTNNYNVILLDYSLPKKNGAYVCEEIRSAGRTTPIIFISVIGEIHHKIDALEKGADDYVTEPFSFEELRARVRAVARRPHRIEGKIMQVADLILDKEKQTVVRDKHHTITLTPAQILFHLKKVDIPGLHTIAIRCGIMSLYGWMAYTIYDNIIDTSEGNEKRTETKQLSLANIFHRKMTLIVSDLATDTSAVQKIFCGLMDILDGADYKNHANPDIAWQKSAGYIFPSLCAIISAGHSGNGAFVKNFLNFFRHYLSAKQIADDIRDWHEDISRGIVTSVTARIRKVHTVQTNPDYATIRAIFLQYAMIPASRDVLRHANLAQKTLATKIMQKNFTDTIFLADLVRPHERAARAILEQSHHI